MNLKRVSEMNGILNDSSKRELNNLGEVGGRNGEGCSADGEGRKLMTSINERGTSRARIANDPDSTPLAKFAAWRRDARDRAAELRRARIGVASAMILLCSSLGVFGAVSTSSPVQAADPPTNTLTLSVVSARTEPRAFGGAGVLKGDPITEFQFMINVDATGSTETQRGPQEGTGCSTADAGYPDNCLWPSINEPSGWAPIYAQGDQTDLPLVNIPDGRYLISLLADGYKIDGAHFCVEMGGGQTVPGCTEPLTGTLEVSMQPNPLPDGTLRAIVFEDNAPTNMGWDTAELYLEGFTGHIFDTLGEVSTDVYGNPLCTRYQGESYDNDPNTTDTYEIPAFDDVNNNGVQDPGEASNFDADGLPIPIPGTGGNCYSDAAGMLAIPHLGSNRYTITVTPPDGQEWIQTTTLEGNHDYDVWLFEGDTGFSTIFARGGEPTPDPIFGYVRPLHNHAPLSTDPADTGVIKGSVVGIKTYTPPKGGAFNYWGGITGTKVGGPIDRPWLSLQDLQGGDTAVWVGRGEPDGSFIIEGVPAGNYSLSWWDEPQDYNLNMVNVTVGDGETIEMGQLPLNGWWTEYTGYVFNDANRNGRMDWIDADGDNCPDPGEGEQGIPNFTLTIRHRENNLYDRGQNTASTDACGYYYFESGYPIGEWTILEAYSDSFFTTGVTYQADNQNTPTTVKGAGVDVGTLPIIGLGGQIDWGVHAYDALGTTGGVDPRNGGIVGTVSYDTTRNELDPRYAATEDWQPGISGIPVHLWAPVDCPASGSTEAEPCDAQDKYRIDKNDGSVLKGALLNSAVSESWGRPTGCTARDLDGNPLIHGVDENVLVPTQETDGECISSFMQGIQFAPYPTDQGTPDANFGAAVNGNYGFGDGCFVVNGATLTPGAFDPNTGDCATGAFTALPAGDYLVEVDPPNDMTGSPMIKPTREEDINIGNGDQIVPQVPPPACAGPLHTVDVNGIGPDDEYPPIVGTGYGPTGNGVPVGVTVPASTPTVNETFTAIDGSPYDGQAKPLCDTKLVELANGKSVAPLFNFFTDVPVPARMRTVLIDDLNFSTDPRSTMYGEKLGVPFIPVGIYDFTNKLVHTTETDFNGFYDVLLPSTNHISCPTPSGVCGNMYRFVANDPGVPGRLNPNYSPRYATHAAGAEGLPGNQTFADLAPTQVGINIETPGTGTSPVTCPQDAVTPQLFAVSVPYVNGSGSFTIDGVGFGAAQGTGSVTLDGTIPLTVNAWSELQIAVTVPAGTPVGPHQLMITADSGQSTVNGLTFHVLGAGYDPNLYEVGPGRTFGVIQDALDAAFSSNGDDLVVVYPGNPDLTNPRNNPNGAYYENIVMASPVKLQGVGPGGFQGATFVPGTILNASNFGLEGFGPDAPPQVNTWFDRVAALTWDGKQGVEAGQAIYVLASENPTTGPNIARQFTENFKASIDGFDIRGAIQNGFPTNFNGLTGGTTGLPPTLANQAGAIFANAFARYLQITNNVVQNNGSAFGTIRIGTPEIPTIIPGEVTNEFPDAHNENVRIANNRIIANAGTNLAGGIGIYAGADNYEVSGNDICGNFSLEYGGGLSVYGRSENGKIHHNRIYYNSSNDEGGGIMIAGQLPADPSTLSPGTGPVDIYNNQIQANLGNDDGGGIRFLMAGGPGGVDEMNVYNNMIVNNVSTHEGGGISLNDSPNVRVFNNTIMKNITTATAVTSDGTPAPGGLSTSANSALLQATLLPGAPTFSDPVLFNNIFWDNRAGTRAGLTVTGIGLPTDATAINQWDLGVAGLGESTSQLSPTNSVIQQVAGTHPYVEDPSNSSADPQVVSTYELSVTFATWRQNGAFVDATLTGVELPPNLQGDYHLCAGVGDPAVTCSAASPAIDLGAAGKGGVNAPLTDFDDQVRPAGTTDPALFDSGADEFGTAPAPEPCPFDPGLTIDDPLCVPPPPPDTLLYFSTVGNVNPPLVTGTPDDSDVYLWDGADFSRIVDATAVACALPAAADVDALDFVDATHYYVSFQEWQLSVVGLGNVRDEDILYCNGDHWELWFDGSVHGLGAGGVDIDALTVTGPTTFYFSLTSDYTPNGVTGGAGDNADIYRHGPNEFDDNYVRVFDATDAGLLSDANIDGLELAGDTHFFASFSSTSTVVPDIGTVQDEDVVELSGGTWSVYFDGTAQGLTGDALDLDALSLSGPIPPPPDPVAQTITFGALANKTFGDPDFDVSATASSGLTVEFAASGNCTMAGLVTVHLTGAGSCTITASQPGNASFLAAPDVPQTFAIAAAPGPIAQTITFGALGDKTFGDPDFDVSATASSGLTVSFAASGACTMLSTVTVHLTGAGSCTITASQPGNGSYLPAPDVPQTFTIAPAPPASINVYFSTLGNDAVPGVGGTPDNADIYNWNGTAFSRALDASGAGSLGINSNANVDGFDYVDATHFYVSFTGNVWRPGIGTTQDEDVLYYADGVWSVFFDGTAHGLTANGHDVDSINVVGNTLYFSTAGNAAVPGVGGTADDSDIYSWDGANFARVWDATANGLPGSADVDGYVRVDDTHFYLSLKTTTTVAGLGPVDDVDVIYNNAGTWSIVFDGSANGLTASSGHDLDAIDVVLP